MDRPHLAVERWMTNGIESSEEGDSQAKANISIEKVCPLPYHYPLSVHPPQTSPAVLISGYIPSRPPAQVLMRGLCHQHTEVPTAHPRSP